jgi:membrane protein YdbS with pleckstrin-like domain
MSFKKQKFYIKTSNILTTVRQSICLLQLTILALLLIGSSIYFTSSEFLQNELTASTVAAIIGTILALVFSLSIIPIQKAGAEWSSAISKLYIDDR